MEIKKGDIVKFDGIRKKVFDIHTNNNIILKINGTLVQVFREKVQLIEK
jgi:putative lipase involved disintegration of autophagic bodies